MNEIKCPNCQKVFQVDESGYAAILKQVHDAEFDKEIERRKQEYENSEKRSVELAVTKVNADKDKQIADLRNELELARQQLASELARVKSESDLKMASKEQKIAELTNQIALSDNEKQLAVTNALHAKDKELADKDAVIVELKGQLKNQETESTLKEKSIEENYRNQLIAKDKEIEFYKDFKARQSTKMVGESLEQHCMTQFNMFRTAAFPNAYFDKDNQVSETGSKGDFIFRDYGEDGTEFISIMFEMKNELDETKTKHKNEDFFKELDKDRNEKGCEYAVLVSLLEPDSELYNSGIVDVSYKYPKMYVIRPQCFIPMITLLRNAAVRSLEVRKELAVIKNQQVDLTNFEENMQAFKEAFGRNYRLASEKFKTAIDEIDKSIQHLQKIKDALVSSENNLRLANNKAEDLSVKKLTKNAPSVKAMLDEIRNQ